MSGNFTDASINDEKLRDIKLVLITALCSKSGVANPVSFVVTEGEGDVHRISKYGWGRGRGIINQGVSGRPPVVCQHGATSTGLHCGPAYQSLRYHVVCVVITYSTQGITHSAREL